MARVPMLAWARLQLSPFRFILIFDTPDMEEEYPPLEALRARTALLDEDAILGLAWLLIGKFYR